MSAGAAAEDTFPAENLSEGSFYSFFFLTFICFDFKSECASENNLTSAARIVIKFHTASVPLGRDTLI